MWPVHLRSARHCLIPAGLLLCAGIVLLAGCDDTPWNRPYSAAEAQENILYSSFQERPKHLDPAQSYSSNEVTFTGQIYEPPLQYHYLKRPYELVPLTASAVPEPHYLDAAGNPLPADAAAADIAYSVYDIRIQPGIRYQPHPAFATDAGGKALYLDLGPQDLENIHSLADF
ncbi:MAG: peptide ABC transporter substrate-binding protein, partial [Gammaproteobacteria bacterium]